MPLLKVGAHSVMSLSWVSWPCGLKSYRWKHVSAAVWEIICLCSAPFQVKGWTDGATASFPHSWVIFHIPSSQPFNLFWTFKNHKWQYLPVSHCQKVSESSYGWHIAAYKEFECPGSRTSSLCLPVLPVPVLHPPRLPSLPPVIINASGRAGVLGSWSRWLDPGAPGSEGLASREALVVTHSTWEASSRPQKSFVNLSAVSIPVLVLGYYGGWS